MILTDGKNLRRNFNAKIFPDLKLAGKPHMILFFLAGKVGELRWQNIAPALQDAAFALAAGTAAAAGRRQKNIPAHKRR